ncbi:MAG: hypothetical protein JNL11_01430 [Bdellovibrionaceae bacterium]|nr:hypothetical protein [Pseudobdellovibrionaceae bacterium]
MALRSLFISFIINLLFFTSLTSAAPLFTGNVPMIQGYTNESDTFITVMRQPGQNFIYSISPDVNIHIAAKNVGHSHHVDTLELSNLKPGIEYQLRVNTLDGKAVDYRKFEVLDPKANNTKAAICSCSRMGILSPDDPKRSMYDRLYDQDPKVIFFLGDQVYGDNAAQAVLRYLTLNIASRIPNFPLYHPTFLQIQKRYINSWKKEKLYHQEKLKPTYSIWDDHDFGFDGADAKNPFKEMILKLYRSYYPAPKDSQVVSRGPGASYSFNIFGKKILMLDNRTFSNFRAGIVLGQEQIQWIESQVKGQSEVIFASGISLIKLSGNQRSVERTSPSEWQQFRQIFFNNPSLRALFFTGDIHYSEVRNIPEHIFGFKTIQIASSHMHSTTPLITPPFRSGRHPKDPNQLKHIAGRNFAIVSLASLFEQTEINFYRGSNRPPINFINETPIANQCHRFYKAE